ncbi:galactose-specific lectin nattectin-like [Corythoichthys intestinalis]|uniref:galactose-specific lectin nattectin-like n=1 Tax=Corythoichthys intestinalis TaxID=161448 RepID=UPI0025A59562|nr:galactose-specific lectin nattectin-like [Corythoichthys intestinalis]XP_061802911.1 galactose-specific lectin nattectin-like [Nerophis lumbriciformis]
MAFALRLLILFCGLSALLTGVLCQTKKGYCPKDWTRLGNYCYIYQHDERTFADSESVCNILGGSLASITSRLQNAIIREVIREGAGSFEDTWIGYHDTIAENAFIWTDGTPNNFEAFASGQPDNFNSNEDCVEFEDLDEMWHDDNCEDENAFVCAKQIHLVKH